MKALVFLLVLANLLFYAFSSGYFGHSDNPDAARIDQQVAPDKMHLVSRGEAPPVKAAEAPAAPAPEPEAKPEPVIEKTCLRWDNLAPAAADRLSTLIGEKFTAFRSSKKTIAGEGNGWWVFIPPLPSKADAEKKAGELRQLGVEDYFIIQENGPSQYGISLGVFSAEKGAQERLTELKGKGVKSARTGPRPGKDSSVRVEASGPLAERDALIAASKIKPPPEDCK